MATPVPPYTELTPALHVLTANAAFQVVVEGPTKGSDSAINNGGMRPGLVGSSPTTADIEMTEGEMEQEDELAAIEER